MKIIFLTISLLTSNFILSSQSSSSYNSNSSTKTESNNTTNKDKEKLKEQILELLKNDNLAKESEKSELKTLLNLNDTKDINVKNAALIKAAEHGYIKIAKVLIQAGARVNGTAKYGDFYDAWYSNTALFEAAKHGHKDMVKLLIEEKANVNVENKYNNTPLIIAAENNHNEIVQLLIKSGAKINDNLILAAEKGYIKAVKLLVKLGADVNSKDRHGNTAMIKALTNNNEEIVSFLKENKAEVDLNLALYEAAQNGQTASIQKLISLGADPNAKNKNSETALSLAVDKFKSAKSMRYDDDDIDYSEGYEAIVKILEKYSDLHSASALGLKDRVISLIKEGIDTNTRNNDNQTALMCAVDKGQINIIKLLLESGADIKAKNNDGYTVLKLAKNCLKNCKNNIHSYGYDSDNDLNEEYKEIDNFEGILKLLKAWKQTSKNFYNERNKHIKAYKKNLSNDDKMRFNALSQFFNEDLVFEFLEYLPEYETNALAHLFNNQSSSVSSSSSSSSK